MSWLLACVFILHGDEILYTSERYFKDEETCFRYKNEYTDNTDKICSCTKE